jgi:hypothetical protein
MNIMLKITLYLLLFAFLSLPGYSQVGINTSSPQKALHVAGSSATIRIDKFNSTNSPSENDGMNLAPVYVDQNGDFVLSDGLGGGGSSPIDFLIEDTNFITNDPYGIGVDSGYVVNSPDDGSTLVEQEIITLTLVVPQDALVEVKYGITVMLEGSDISSGILPYDDVDYDQSIIFGSFFCIDIDGGGLNPAELANTYGRAGQYYETQYGGITNYTYLNGQAYLALEAGTYTVYLFGSVNDHGLSYTSVGYGGSMDLLKIRIYN